MPSSELHDEERPLTRSGSGLNYGTVTGNRVHHGSGGSDDDNSRIEWLEGDTPIAPLTPVTRSASPVSSHSSHRDTSRISNKNGTNIPELDETPEVSPTARRRRQYSVDEENDTSVLNPEPEPESSPEDDKPVSWSSLPKKGQLAILTFARLSEPLAQTSLQAYMFYQLKSFNPDLPDSTISAQTGVLQGAFTAAQFFTSVMWGRLADTETFGRKRVLLIGLSGTCISCIGFGFSKSFIVAAVFRTLGGALNSNIGVMRTMISEIIEEKKYQARAFLLLPMCFNIGVIIGPILGGILADPVQSYPGIFGPGSFLGGEDGVWWMRQWPYAFPNLISSFIIFTATIGILLGLEETHELAKHRKDWGLQLGKTISRFITRKPGSGYERLDEPDRPPSLIERRASYVSGTSTSTIANDETSSAPIRRKRISVREIWTRNVLLTLLTRFLLGLHASAFNALCFTFLPTPRDPGSWDGFLRFGGGLGMPSSKVGLATSIIGFVGLPLQIFVYPWVQFKLGTLKSFRVFLPFSPMAYLLAPFLVLVPNQPYLVWPALTVVISLQVISRTFSLPATAILVNNSVPDTSVLGTVHGVAQSVTSAAATLGPVIAGWGLGLGLKHNIVGAIWWVIALEAMLNWVLTWTIYEGKGRQKKP